MASFIYLHSLKELRLETWAPAIELIWIKFDTTKVENTVSALKGRLSESVGGSQLRNESEFERGFLFGYLFHSLMICSWSRLERAQARTTDTSGIEWCARSVEAFTEFASHTRIEDILTYKITIL